LTNPQVPVWHLEEKKKTEKYPKKTTTNLRKIHQKLRRCAIFVPKTGGFVSDFAAISDSFSSQKGD